MPRCRKKAAAAGDLALFGDVPRTFKTATPASNHTRKESMVPMRDGVKLFTIIAMPGDATGSMPMGHIAVVSDVVSPREIRVDHANWKRNQVSLKMAVIDVSKANDWSAVQVESQPGAFGSTYPINGFIYPTGG